MLLLFLWTRGDQKLLIIDIGNDCTFVFLRKVFGCFRVVCLFVCFCYGFFFFFFFLEGGGRWGGGKPEENIGLIIFMSAKSAFRRLAHEEREVD